MKETKGRRRKRLFVGMNLADLRLLRDNYKGDKLIRGIKDEELGDEIRRREKIAATTKHQPRAGGRYAAAKVGAKRPEDEKPTKKATTQVIVMDWAEVEVSLRRIVREELAAKPHKRRGLWQRWFGWPE